MELESFLKTASGLLAIPSTADRPGDLRRALDFVLDYAGAGNSGMTVEWFTSGGKPSALVYPGGARGSFGVILNGHLDVVPAPDGQFRPRRDGARLYARGAQDMKRRPELAALRDAVRRTGFDGGFLRKHGTGDARFYRTHGMNAVSFGIGGEGQHGPDEFADISTIVPYHDALADFLKTFTPNG